MNIHRSKMLPCTLAALLAASVGACTARPMEGRQAFNLPDPAVKTTPASTGDQVAVLAGGCFWGMEEVFEHVRGVKEVTAGYSGGAANTATYGQVSDGDTGHAESVRIVYDPQKVSYGELLKVYFSVAHNPTELNRQGPDSGSQYRSEIFYTTPQQRTVASDYIRQLGAATIFGAPIVTEIQPLKAFYKAEDYHQDYADQHPDSPYIVYNDAPKVVHLQQMLPGLYRAARTPSNNVVQVTL